MKKRFDMIEQLLGAVKGYTKFEREVFEKVATLRAQVMSAGPANLGEHTEGERKPLRQHTRRRRGIPRPQGIGDREEAHGRDNQP